MTSVFTDIDYVYVYCMFILALHDGAAHMASQKKSETFPSLLFGVVSSICFAWSGSYFVKIREKTWKEEGDKHGQ